MSKGEKLVSQCNALYKRFNDDSKIVSIEGNEVRIWSGGVVETALDVGIPYGSYGACMKALTYLGCIEVIRSGARNTSSAVVLHREPTDLLWAGYSDAKAQALTKHSRSATLTAEAERIIQSLGGVNISKVLINHEERITALEAIKERDGKTA